MDAFGTRKTFHELYLHRVVLENDPQCSSVTGADQWNVGIVLMSIAKNSNTLPAEKGMEVMNSTGSRWKPSLVVGNKVKMILPTTLRLFRLFSHWAFASGKLPNSLRFVSRQQCVTRKFLIDSRLLVKCKLWLSMTVASCCLYLLDHPKFGQGSLQNFNLMNLSFCARMTLAGLLISWLYIG